MRETVFLNKCLQLVEEKTLWGSHHDWTNYNYSRLSELINEETGVNISVSTLKRIYKKYADGGENNPQVETKNALAVYLGYKNWNDFEKNHRGLIVPEAKNQEDKPVKNTEPKKSIFRFSSINGKYKFFIALAVVVLVTIQLYYSFLNNSQHGFYLKAQPVVGTAPLAAGFDYKIPIDRFDISMDFGEGPTCILDPDKQFIAHFYKLPDYYKIRLFDKNGSIDSTYAFVRSDAWIKGITNDRFGLYISKDFNKAKKELSTKHAKLDSLGIDNQRFWAQYRNFTEFSVSGDNFTMETMVKNDNAEGGIDYNDIIITLVGEYGSIELFFIRKGFSVYSDQIFSDVKLYGEQSDLSVFGQDLRQWGKVGIISKDKKIAVSFNDTTIYNVTYTKPIGMIKGVIYNFRGFGNVKDLKLRNEMQEEVYNYEFD